MRRVLLAALALSLRVSPALAQALWETLPPTPTLPRATSSGVATINGVRIWHAEFGQGPPVILLHGGLANSAYRGLQVRVLQSRYRVIVMDSRGHGRSTRDASPFSYHGMAEDVVALMGRLKIARAAVVGWSDGAIIGLDLAIHHPDRLTALFAFAANSTVAGSVDSESLGKNAVFTAYTARAGTEYQKVSPTPTEFAGFLDQMSKMWASQPDFSLAQLAAIRTPTWIVDGDRDEVIRRDNTELMAATIPGAGLLILPQVSHFAFLQDPRQFNEELLRFLQRSLGEGR